MDKIELIKDLIKKEDTSKIFKIVSTKDEAVLHITDGYYQLGRVKNEIKKTEQVMFCSPHVDISTDMVIKDLLNGIITVDIC